MTIGRIVLAAGAVVPSHHHVHEQVANVLAGRLRFVVGDDEQTVSAGESVFIPSEIPHSVEAIEDSGPRLVLAVQWHAEGLTALPRHRALFAELVEASSAPAPRLRRAA